MNKLNFNNSGFSLIELVIAIVILSIGVTAFITLVINTTKNSIDPQIRQQGNAIARAYLEEIMLNSFCEPDFDPDTDPVTTCPLECLVSACSTVAPNACAGANAIGGAEAGRAVFDDVCDYNGLVDAGAVDQNGNAIGTLGNYTVNVTVDDAGVNLNGLNGSNGQVVLINVNVTHSTGATMSLSSYKTNF
jgi:MSHA pilin protein MshD